jgi:uncharacterized protein
LGGGGTVPRMSMRPCPVCERLFEPEKSQALPFCSARCRLADLNRWLVEGYGLPYQPAEDEQRRDVSPSEEAE